MSPRSSAAAAPALDAAVESPPPPAAEYRVVPIDQVVTSPLNPRVRGRGKSDEFLAELVASIRAHGIVNPILVRDGSSLDGTQVEYEVVAGNRRRRAAAKAGLTHVPVTVRKVTDQELLELALQENVHRSDMHPLDEANALVRLQTLDGALGDVNVLAAKVGRSATYVRGRLSLLRLDPLVIEALEAGAIHVAHAERIARLPADQHEAALAACFLPGVLIDEDDDRTAAHVPTPESCIAASRWNVLAPALKSLREFDRWIQAHGKADVTAPEVQEQLRDLVIADSGGEDAIDPDPGMADIQMAEALEEATASLLQLSTSGAYEFGRKQAKDIGVVHQTDWHEIANEKDRCEHAQRGAVVHPEGQLRLVDACTSKRKCAKHWPDTAAGVSGKAKAKGTKQPSAYDSYQAAERKRQQREAEWKAVEGRYYAALGAVTKGAKVTVALVRALLSDWQLKGVLDRFGVKLTDATIGQVLALSTVRTSGLEWFAQDAKALGLDVAKLTKQIKAEQKAAVTGDTPPRGLSNLQLVVWRAMGTYADGRSRFYAAVHDDLDNQRLDKMIREELGTGGQSASDYSYDTNAGELHISRPLKRKLTVAEVRAVIREVCTMAPPAPAAKPKTAAKKKAGKAKKGTAR